MNFSNQKPFVEAHDDLKVHMIPCRNDNYSFVLETKDKKALMVDSTLKEPVMNFLKTNDLKLEGILLTHHHYDHVDKVEDFQTEFDCKIYCSEFDSKRPDIGGEKTIVSGGTELNLLGIEVLTLETPGHTKSHLSYFLKNQNLLFCGDTLFSLGCGRVFENYPTVYEDFYASMQTIKKHCNSDTSIYCAHEYTKANLNFLKSKDLASTKLIQEVDRKLNENSKTVPTQFNFELENNPFLNSKSPQEFQTLRESKDKF